VKRKGQTIDALAQEQLPEGVNKAIDGVELRLESQSTRWLHIVANRTRCEIHLVLSWKAAAFAFGLMKVGKSSE
jgi:hypothetical protein